jgi:hypothetical protein
MLIDANASVMMIQPSRLVIESPFYAMPFTAESSRNRGRMMK